MRVLVTGGAGFIGSHLAGALSSGGADVVVIDDLSSGSAHNILKEWAFIEGDVRDAGTLESAQGPFQTIYHLASHVGQELSYERPAHDFQVNALATSQLAQWAMENGSPRLVFASSMNVYGDPISGAELVDESEPPNPPSPYAVAKLASEGLLDVLGAVGLDGASLRLFNVYGPGQDLDNMKQGMVSIFLSFVLRGEPINVRGSMNRFRDFVFVDDVVGAFLTLGRLPGVTGQFNVGTGRKTTVRELLHGICTAMGVDPAEYEITEAEGTIRDQFGIYADITKISRLGWSPIVELSQGLDQMADWARSSRFAAG